VKFNFYDEVVVLSATELPKYAGKKGIVRGIGYGVKFGQRLAL
jgi:hypothetical protein